MLNNMKLKENINNNKKDIINLILMCSVFVFFFFLFQANYYSSTGFLHHNEFAVEILRGTEWVASHPAYHFIIDALYLPFSSILSVKSLSLIFLAGIQVLQYWFVEKFFYKTLKNFKLSSIFSILLLIIGSIYNPVTNRFFIGQFGANDFSSPTYILLKVLLIIFIICFWEYYKKDGFNKLHGVILGLLFAFSTLAKPNATIIIVPAFFLLFLYNLIKKEKTKAYKLALVSIIPIIMLGVLYLFTYGQGSEYGGMVFAPFSAWMGRIGGRSTIPISIILTSAAPLALLIFKKFINKDKLTLEFKMSWIIAILGVIVFLLLAETGSKAAHTNFMSTTLAGFLILYLYSFNEYLTSKWTKKQNIILLILLLAHIISSLTYIGLLFMGVTAWVF